MAVRGLTSVPSLSSRHPCGGRLDAETILSKETIMAGDLEDFLRRAAQRRQANAAGQSAATPPPAASRPAASRADAPAPRRKPQYSDSRTERVTSDHAEEILVAEVVQETQEKPSPWQERQRKIEQAKRAAVQAEADAAAALKKVKASNRAKSPPASEAETSDDLAADLLRLLQSPAGIRQAVLLREILDRPIDRW
ncbi:MAG: hypothetical protein ACF788_12770 [Novipirellula sp. JB048]